MLNSSKRENAPKLKVYFAASFVYLLITLIMFWPITLNPTQTIVSGWLYSADKYNSLWNLWWVPYSIFSLHSNPYNTNLLFYPIGANLVTNDNTLLAGLIFYLFQRISLVFEYNLIFITSFVLSGIFMFMLARYLVKDSYAAFIAGLIFAFSPMHIAQAYVHLNWASVEFIPLFILFFLLSIEKPSLRYKFIAAIAFLFVTFFGDIEQGIISVFFILMFFLFAEIKKIERFRISKEKFWSIFAIFAIVLLLGLPFFVPIIQFLLTPQSLSSANSSSPPIIRTEWSNNLLSFFLPSFYNGIFSNFSLSYFGSVFAPDINERVSFLGYSVLFLAIIAILYNRKNKKKFREIQFWFYIVLIFLLLSLGPIVFVGRYAVFFGPYLIYYFIPLFNIVREPGRFDVIVTVALAILASIGFSNLRIYIAERHKHIKMTALSLTVLFSILILIEYNGMPTKSMVQTIFTTLRMPVGYSIISQASGNAPVLILPDMLNVEDNGAYSIPTYQGMAMYYQTSFAKPIFDGYISRQTEMQDDSAYAFPLSFQSGLLADSIYNLSDAYPITENYTYTEAVLAKIYNISYIAIIKPAFSASAYKVLDSYLKSSFGEPVYSSNSTAIFNASGAISNYPFTESTAYIGGTWNFANNTWNEDNTSAIYIYAVNTPYASIYLHQFSIDQPAYECVNGNFIATLNSSKIPENTTLNIPVQTGINTLNFSASKSCNEKGHILWETDGITINYSKANTP